MLVALLLIAVLGDLVSVWAIARLAQTFDWVDHTREVLDGLDRLQIDLTDAETAERGFLLTEDPAYREPDRTARRSIDGTGFGLALRSEQATAAPLSDLAGRTILVADDQAPLRHLTRRFLERAGATVVETRDGRETVARILAGRNNGDESRRIDLVLLDMQMPLLSGPDVVAELRRAGRDLPVLALTASAMAEDRERCLAAGCDDFLSKPIESAELIAAAARWIGQRDGTATADVTASID